MSEAHDFNTLYERALERVRTTDQGVWVLSVAVSAVRAQESERRALLQAACPSIDDSSTVQALLYGVVADAVSLSTAEAIRRLELRAHLESTDGSRSIQPLQHALVDLWGQAEAVRAVWQDRFVRYPESDREERNRTISTSCIAVVSAMAAVAVPEGWDVAALAPELAGLRRD